MKKFHLIVLDSVGIGELPDAAEFGDFDVNTLQHTFEYNEGLNLKNMQDLGYFNIEGLDLPKVKNPKGAIGRSMEKSLGKDTLTGHYEIAGLILEEPYKIYMDGFPKRIIDEFEKRIGRKTIGNYLASGTEIIQELGDEHVKTGSPIIYVSADSLMQIAMHEEVIPLEEQYRIGQIAREMLMGDDIVARIICRPFIGENGAYVRTENRKDLTLDPPGKTILDYLSESGKEVAAVGKIEDIFNKNGITKINHARNNQESIEAHLEYQNEKFEGLIFTNLVDFDMTYGHRRDPKGYGKALEYFDKRLPEIIAKMGDEDILLITADHGCDPTYKGTDHTREYIPLLLYGKNIKAGASVGTRETFADIAATIGEFFEVQSPAGTSFLGEIIK